jgi:anthranilate phosphoribosyltransferase
MTIVEAIKRALAREDLSRDDMAAVIGQIMDGAATPAQIGGLLVALRAKGETVDELVGAATAMRARSLAVDVDPARAIDTCGTGGDGAGTINVSTLAAIVVAACGGVVAKHGNRAQSSKCGSADVLEALGVVADAPPEVVARCVRDAGIGFCFAPRFHAATRHASGPRKELGTRTIFNLLGPLTNPACVRHQVVGVYDDAWCEPVAMALGALGARRAAVVHGHGALDELAVRGESYVAIFDDGRARMEMMSPASFGARAVDPAGLAGGDPARNAEIARALFAGERVEEAVRVAVAMTAALALELLDEGALDLGRLSARYERATSAMIGGEAARVLARWQEASRS